ncbi:MAG: alanine racemase [Pseudoruegeria sp.]
MGTGHLSIDLSALTANWRALNALSDNAVETAAVVKADGYGLSSDRVSKALAEAGARRFFVATAEEGGKVRGALGPGPEINVFGGHMAGDTDMIHDLQLTPMLNSIEQITRHAESLPNHPFGVQLDSGMNRLGLEAGEWSAISDIALEMNPTLLMSHLACADEPNHGANAAQLANFRSMTDGIPVRRSLAATGGVLLGKEFHFQVTRPGIGLYGGQPFAGARPVVKLSLPVIQIRDVVAGEVVGYGCAWQAEKDSRIATLSGGYADGLIRAMSSNAVLYDVDTPCPLVGRVSMDLLTVDVTHLPEIPKSLDILGPQQTVDTLADAAGTIGYEILTSLGHRYHRNYMAPSK